MGVMKFKIAKFPLQFSGNYNRVWRQAVLFPLKKCRVCWIKVLMQILGNAMLFLQSLGLFWGLFLFLKDVLPQLIHQQ